MTADLLRRMPLTALALFIISFSAPQAAAQEEFRYLIIENGAYGFVDRDGEVVIAPSFAEASEFSGGYAAVRIDDKWGYIDTSGELVIEARFGAAFPFAGGRARVQNAETGS